MKRIIYLFFVLISVVACKEEETAKGPDTQQPDTTVPSPQLSSRGINASNFTFAVTLEEEAAAGTFYYVVLKAENDKPLASEMKGHQLVQHFPMAGGNLKTVNMPGLSSKTTYVVYGMMEIEGALSALAQLEVTTL